MLEDPPLYFGEFGLREFAPRHESLRALAGRPVAELLEPVHTIGGSDEAAITLSQVDPLVFAGSVDGSAYVGFDTDALLRAIECPVLMLVGNRQLSSALYDGEAERALSLLRHGHAIRFEETGHLVHTQAPGRFVEVVGEFLGELGL